MLELFHLLPGANAPQGKQDDNAETQLQELKGDGRRASSFHPTRFAVPLVSQGQDASAKLLSQQKEERKMKEELEKDFQKRLETDPGKAFLQAFKGNRTLASIMLDDDHNHSGDGPSSAKAPSSPTFTLPAGGKAARLQAISAPSSASDILNNLRFGNVPRAKPLVNSTALSGVSPAAPGTQDLLKPASGDIATSRANNGPGSPVQPQPRSLSELPDVAPGSPKTGPPGRSSGNGGVKGPGASSTPAGPSGLIKGYYTAPPGNGIDYKLLDRNPRYQQTPPLEGVPSSPSGRGWEADVGAVKLYRDTTGAAQPMDQTQVRELAVAKSHQSFIAKVNSRNSVVAGRPAAPGPPISVVNAGAGLHACLHANDHVPQAALLHRSPTDLVQPKQQQQQQQPGSSSSTGPLVSPVTPPLVPSPLHATSSRASSKDQQSLPLPVIAKGPQSPTVHSAPTSPLLPAITVAGGSSSNADPGGGSSGNSTVTAAAAADAGRIKFASEGSQKPPASEHQGQGQGHSRSSSAASSVRQSSESMWAASGRRTRTADYLEDGRTTPPFERERVEYEPRPHEEEGARHARSAVLSAKGKGAKDWRN